MRHLVLDPSASDAPSRPQRFRRGKGTPYVPDVVERVRVFVEGSTLPEAEIAARVGIGVATVHGWKVRRGWTRPAGTPIAPRAVGLHRAGFTRRFREALAGVEAMAACEAARLRTQPDPAALRRAEALVAAARRQGRFQPGEAPT